MIAQGTYTYLRPVRMDDAPLILDWENRPDLWSVSGQNGPFTLAEIQTFIRECSDLRRDGQMRYIICKRKSRIPVGAIDLFEFHGTDQTAGIGILIAKPEDRNAGLATDALSAFLNYFRKEKGLKLIWCLIYPDNQSSIRLFEKHGFTPAGVELFRDKKAIRYLLSLS